MLAASLDALGNNASSAFTGIITGTQTGEEAIRSLANPWPELVPDAS